MGKKKLISELTNILAIALRHKIGSIVNSQEIYSQKYAKDAEILVNEAKNLLSEKKFNQQDKTKIKNNLKSKLYKELQQKEFINSRKFDLIEPEIENVLIYLDLK